MTAFIQFIVLKREGKWVVKSKDLERSFSVQQEAVDAAIRFANDSGKEGKPGVVLFQNSKSKFEKIWTYGQSPIRQPDQIYLRFRGRRKNWRTPSVRRNAFARPAAGSRELSG
jgi:hypothetical protein